ncbi:MAG: sigma-54-dependent Fis family transcriptional regulator, partial [Pseudomonadota bacterium]|nr:sigma-54-dependent Fis family transcriptional regulator [Pseudomonadota bacterium]
MHTLFTWLGNRDIENMEQEQSAAIVSLATKSEIPFDKIVILSNKDEAKWDSFERFLKKRMAMISRPSEDIKIHLA